MLDSFICVISTAENVCLVVLLFLQALRISNFRNRMALFGAFVMLVETPYLLRLYQTDAALYSTAFSYVGMLNAVFLGMIALALDRSDDVQVACFMLIAFQLTLKLEIAGGQDFVDYASRDVTLHYARQLVDFLWTTLLCVNLYNRHVAQWLQRRTLCLIQRARQSMKWEQKPTTPLNLAANQAFLYLSRGIHPLIIRLTATN